MCVPRPNGDCGIGDSSDEDRVSKMVHHGRWSPMVLCSGGGERRGVRERGAYLHTERCACVRMHVGMEWLNNEFAVALSAERSLCPCTTGSSLGARDGMGGVLGFVTAQGWIRRE